MREDTTDWKAAMADWQTRYHFSVRKPVGPQVLQEVEAELGNLPTDLKSFYQFCNGLTSKSFMVLPVEDPADIKHMWDGIRRANAPVKTVYLERDQELLQRFLVFASLDAGQCAVIDRVDNSIWYEEDSELHQTDLTLQEFIDVCLREAQEL